jgi:hypothetical protein
MLDDVTWSPPSDDSEPTAVRLDVNSDINRVLVYRQGFHDGADGRGPFRDAWAYQRGWNSGAGFRDRVSGKSQPLESHFPAWPTGTVMATIGARGGLVPRSLLCLLARFR